MYWDDISVFELQTVVEVEFVEDEEVKIDVEMAVLLVCTFFELAIFEAL